ncbi:hypothetical protein BGX23_012011 [Mortierella sp. AD031]|nr:hypothetical protein BGX23_012011 [Mortierella sp. AD031]
MSVAGYRKTTLQTRLGCSIFEDSISCCEKNDRKGLKASNDEDGNTVVIAGDDIGDIPGLGGEQDFPGTEEAMARSRAEIQNIVNPPTAGFMHLQDEIERSV